MTLDHSPRNHAPLDVMNALLVHLTLKKVPSPLILARFVLRVLSALRGLVNVRSVQKGNIPILPGLISADGVHKVLLTTRKARHLSLLVNHVRKEHPLSTVG